MMAAKRQPEHRAAPTRDRRARDRVGLGFEDATMERLKQAGRDGASIDQQGVRRLADPFDILRAKGLLDKKDDAINDVLWHAGERYRHYWQAAGMNGLAAMDLTRDVVDGGTSSGGMPSSEFALRARQEVRQANVVIGPRHAALFCAVVLHGQTIASQRHLIGDTDRDKTADSLALDRLRDCLHRLCDLWGMKPNNRPRKMASWHAE